MVNVSEAISLAQPTFLLAPNLYTVRKKIDLKESEHGEVKIGHDMERFQTARLYIAGLSMGRLNMKGLNMQMDNVMDLLPVWGSLQQPSDGAWLSAAVCKGTNL